MHDLQRSKNLASINRWRARVFGNGGEFTADEWQILCDAYGNVCLCCRADTILTVDHVIPISHGGPNTIDNIQPLCRACNNAKGAKAIDYRGVSPVELSLGNAVSGDHVLLRLDVTRDERDLIRRAAALAGYRSMAEFCRSVVLKEAANVAANVATSKRNEETPHSNA